jgi:hypothetical protein
MERPELCDKCEGELGRWVIGMIFELSDAASKKGEVKEV